MTAVEGSAGSSEGDGEASLALAPGFDTGRNLCVIFNLHSATRIATSKFDTRAASKTATGCRFNDQIEIAHVPPPRNFGTGCRPERDRDMRKWLETDGTPTRVQQAHRFFCHSSVGWWSMHTLSLPKICGLLGKSSVRTHSFAMPGEF